MAKKEKKDKTIEEAKAEIRKILDKLKPLKINVKDLNFIIKAIRNVETGNKIINKDGLELSTQIKRASNFEEDPNSIPYLVKLSVLKSAGRTNKPQDLKDDTSLTDLLMRPEQFVLLRAYLVEVIKHFESGGTISITEIEGCETVGDLVELVTGKIE